MDYASGSNPSPDSQTLDHARALQDKSLKAAGLSFLVADSALFASGFISKQPGIMSAGVAGLTAGFVGSRYGNPKAEKQLEQIYRHLGNYLRKEGVTIPETISAEALVSKGGLIDRIESFLYSHPSQVMNVLYALVGEEFARTALSGDKPNKSLLTSGCLLIAGALLGIIIKEKKPDPEHPAENPIQRAVQWVQEKPLRLTGIIFNANQVFLAINAVKQWQESKGGAFFKAIAVACFVFGNIMMTLTSKTESNEQKMDEGVKNALLETTARVITAQPKEMQQALLGNVAEFLSKEPNVKMNAEQINTLLTQKLAQMTPNLPAKNWPDRARSAGGAGAQPSF